MPMLVLVSLFREKRSVRAMKGIAHQYVDIK